MNIKYLPDVGLIVLGMQLTWGDRRTDVRNLLKSEYEVNDNIIDLSIYNGGDSEFNIYQRRDIYKNINGSECLFYFNYHKNDFLRDIEIHRGGSIEVGKVKIAFDESIDKIVQELKTISNKWREVDAGQLLFEDLKLLIASNESMGGIGDELGYIYMSKDISHLIQD